MRKFELFYDGDGRKSFGMIGWHVLEHVNHGTPTVNHIGYGLPNFDDAIRAINSLSGGTQVYLNNFVTTEY